MKHYEIARCKRLGLGLDQKEFAELVGVSSSTISRFEKDGNVSDGIVKLIHYTLKREYLSLSKKEYLEADILARAQSLEFETNKEKKLNTLSYIVMDIAKLELELRKETDEIK